MPGSPLVFAQDAEQVQARLLDRGGLSHSLQQRGCRTEPRTRRL